MWSLGSCGPTDALIAQAFQELLSPAQLDYAILREDTPAYSFAMREPLHTSISNDTKIDTRDPKHLSARTGPLHHAPVAVPSSWLPPIELPMQRHCPEQPVALLSLLPASPCRMHVK
eukprot:2748698-Amphidinium_carterae.1